MAPASSEVIRIGVGVAVLSLLGLVAVVTAQTLDSALLGVVVTGLLVVTGAALARAIRSHPDPAHQRR
jgi:hypothetical protein